MEYCIIKKSTIAEIADILRYKNGISRKLSISDIIEEIDKLESVEAVGANEFIEGTIKKISGDIVDYRNNCFHRMKKLEEVYFPNVQTVHGFFYCTSLKKVAFPAATSIYAMAFYGCSSLSEVYFPKVRYIDRSSFCLCNSLESAEFPNAEIIETTAFGASTSAYINEYNALSLSGLQACVNLKHISLPKVSAIYSYAFTQCYSLESINLPMGQVIERYAFVSCSSLSMVSLPRITRISAGAFIYCKSLKSVYLLGSSVPTFEGNIFPETPIENSSYLGTYGSIFVKSSMIDSFRIAVGWSSLSNRITVYEEES